MCLSPVACRPSLRERAKYVTLVPVRRRVLPGGRTTCGASRPVGSADFTTQEARLGPFSTGCVAAWARQNLRRTMWCMVKPTPLPEPFGPIPFRVGDALLEGLTRPRLRRSDLVAPIHGVRVLAGVDCSVVEAVAAVLRSDQWFSHTTAARLWGGPLPRDLSDDVHVSTAGDRSMRRSHVVGHRCAHADVRDHPVGRVSAPARTWVECAEFLGERDLVALGDYFVGRSGLATIDDLAAAIRPGSRGARSARAALRRIRVGAESPMETVIRLAVVDAGFPEPELNIDVHGAGGEFLGRVDMAWPSLRIALEYDGDHHREREQYRHDQRRGNGFAANDWLVIHATAADVSRPAVMFERLRQAFIARAGEKRRARVTDRAERDAGRRRA